MNMGYHGLWVAVLALGGCSGNDNARSPRTADAPPAVEPTKIAGDYEVWICETAECGPGTQMTGARMGRLILMADHATDLTTTGPSFGGCFNISPVERYDPSARRTPTIWQPADTAGQIRFSIDRAANEELEIRVRDEGGMLRGLGRVRREGVFAEDDAKVVVARRLTAVAPTSCPAPEPAAERVTPAKPVPKKSANSPPTKR